MSRILASNDVEVNSLVEGSGVTSLDMKLKSNCNSEENQGFEDVEKKEVKRKEYCGKYTMFGEIKRRLKTHNIVIRHMCKTWGCGLCGPKKLASVKRGIYREADRWQLRRFLTLTLPGDFKGSYKESVEVLNNCWKKFGIYFKRKFDKKLVYIKVVEPQKRGIAHLHVLVSCYISQGWLSKAWQAIGGRRICDIRFVDIHRIAAYVSKYMSKAMIGDDLGPYRRYRTSQEIKINGAKQPPEGNWVFLRESIDDAFDHEQNGRGVIIQVEKKFDGEIRMYEVEFAT